MHLEVLFDNSLIEDISVMLKTESKQKVHMRTPRGEEKRKKMKWLPASLLCTLILASTLALLQLQNSYGLIQDQASVTYQFSGRKIDIYTQKEPMSGRGSDQPSDAFAQDEEATLFANVTFNDAPVPNRIVVFEIRGPINQVENISFIRTAVTDVNGVANVSFRIPTKEATAEEAVFGVWNSTATVEIGQVQVKDTVSFQVGWILEILSCETVDAANVSKTSFRKDEQVYFRVSIKSIAKTDKVATLIINTYDSANTHIGNVTIKDQIVPSGTTSFLSEGFSIIERALVGAAKAYVEAFTALPSEGGKPWSPAVSTNFEITAVVPPPSQPTELSWLLYLIIIIALAGAVLSGFFIQRRRRGKQTAQTSEPALAVKTYRRNEKHFKATKNPTNSYVCPHCGIYHLTWRKSSVE